ncbi:hypothetical protein, partial [Novosphingobium sp. 9U]|uniref:hypothetical protein n=1 Tax=Novosphingobium sp. 9U TaxID=2653158 RepID=UPI001F1E59F5
CSPLMLGPVTNREPVLHHTGEQPPASAPIVLCGSAPRDYTMFSNVAHSVLWARSRVDHFASAASMQ